MVFCYKLITDTPGRTGATSPVKKSTGNLPSSLSQLINTVDYENGSLIDAIPEHDWRLLAALARKREHDDERERLADQFRKMWQKEKQEKEIVEAETSGQYKRYLHKKRQEERSWQEFRQLQRSVDQHIRRGQLLNCIKYKEQRSAGVLADVDDKKVADLMDKAIEEEARAQLAADRRIRMLEAQQYRRWLDLVDAEKRATEADNRRNALLRDTSQRVAISNALSSWESRLARQETRALASGRLALHAARAERSAARADALLHDRHLRRMRAQRLASLTALMRDVIRRY